MVTELWHQRLLRGWTQADLARELRISRQTVNAIERGRRSPSLRLALALARTLEIDVTRLFDRRAQLRIRENALREQ